MNQILQFEEKAKKRYDKGDFFWELRNCAYYDLFEQPKVVFPNLQNKNKFSFDESGAYVNAPAVILPTKDTFLVAILNSKLVWYFLANICVVRSGGYIEVKPQYFEQIPIPEVSEEKKTELTEATEKPINLTKESHKVNQGFASLLNAKFNIEKPSKKLQNWHELTFKDFLNELTKALKSKGARPLALAEESEWLTYFEEQKAKATALQTQITTLDREIDQLVYQLYNLTPEEIAIVEGEN